MDLDRPWKEILKSHNDRANQEGWDTLADAPSVRRAVIAHCGKYDLPQPPERKAGRRAK
jgi:hypothetical protein